MISGGQPNQRQHKRQRQHTKHIYRPTLQPCPRYHGYVPPREVEDIVQETYVRVCQVKHPENIRQPWSCLFKTARNLALDSLKRAEAKYTDGMDEQDIDSLIDTSAGDDSTSDQIASNQEFALFCEAVVF